MCEGGEGQRVRERKRERISGGPRPEHGARLRAGSHDPEPKPGVGGLTK